VKQHNLAKKREVKAGFLKTVAHCLGRLNKLCDNDTRTKRFKRMMNDPKAYEIKTETTPKDPLPAQSFSPLNYN